MRNTLCGNIHIQWHKINVAQVPSYRTPNTAASENSPHRNPSRDSGLWQSQEFQVSSKATANHGGSQSTLLESPVLNNSFLHALH